MIHRRAFLNGGAAVVNAWRAMPANPSCTLTAEQKEGPYYFDYNKVRTDITEGKLGIPLKLRIAFVDAKRCTPLSNASLDIWHCDAQGVSLAIVANGGGFGSHGPGGPSPTGPPPGGKFGPPRDGGVPLPGSHRGLDKTRFLRGVQTSDTNGMVEFSDSLSRAGMRAAQFTFI